MLIEEKKGFETIHFRALIIVHDQMFVHSDGEKKFVIHGRWSIDLEVILDMKMSLCSSLKHSRSRKSSLKIY